MPKGSTVRPQKWTNVKDLFDDGKYSAIWGTYEGRRRRCLGVRWSWSGGTGLGYPSRGAYPLWYVEPAFVTEPILRALLAAVIQKHGEDHLYTRNLKIALKEFLTP